MPWPGIPQVLSYKYIIALRLESPQCIQCMHSQVPSPMRSRGMVQDLLSSSLLPLFQTLPCWRALPQASREKGEDEAEQWFLSLTVGCDLNHDNELLLLFW